MFRIFKRKPRIKMSGKPIFEESEELESFTQRAYNETNPKKRKVIRDVLMQICNDQW